MKIHDDPRKSMELDRNERKSMEMPNENVMLIPSWTLPTHKSHIFSDVFAVSA
jgi:hypothetical protein